MIKETHFLDFYNSLSDNDSARCKSICNSLINDGVALSDIYVNLFQRALYRIGNQWEKNRLSIADEHLASQIIETLMSYLYTNSKCRNSNGNTVLVTCIGKEFHELGAKMVSHIFEINGWKTFFLGANTPTKDIVKMVKDKQPKIVGLSLSFYLNYLRLIEIIEAIHNINPNVEIIVGGQGIDKKDNNFFKKYPHVKYFESVIPLDVYLKSLK